jgi:cardiolipin synthase A/B
MKYRFYTTSNKAWDGMFKAISEATKSIYLEMYIFLDDTNITHNFLGLLKDKARQGVEVIIIADAFGSHELKTNSINELRESGVEFIFFSHLLRRTHRKILILDNKTAFLGGVNIEEKTRYWRDLQIRLSGKIIMPIIKSFAYAYKMSGGQKISILQYNDHSFPKIIQSWLIDNWSNTQHSYYLSNYYRAKIIGAQKSIKIVTPYLLPPRWLLALLDSAVRRGVEVEIIMPHDTDYEALNKINYLNTCRLSALGVKCYFLPIMNHAKLMLVDDEEGVIGSQNFDILSFGPNMEVGIFFTQKDIINSLVHLLNKWKKESVLFIYKDQTISWRDHILIFIFKFFYPIF